MKNQQGFTLIELIVVIVILGIVGAAATARFQDLSGEAITATGNGIKAELESSASINYAKSLISNSALVTIEDGETCADVSTNLLQNGLPTGWSMATATLAACTASGVVTTECTLQRTGDTGAYSETLSLICTG